MLAALLLATAACASGRPPPSPGEALRRAVAEPARIAPEASYVGVEAGSSQAAWGQIVRARTEKPLETSLLLARAFEETRRAPAEIVVGGPYPKLTEQVLLDAFALARGRLDGLSLVHVSPAPFPESLRRQCSLRGAECQHQHWVSPAPE